MASPNKRDPRNRPSQHRTLGSPSTWRGGGEFGASQFEQEYQHPRDWPPRQDDEEEDEARQRDDDVDRPRDDDEPPLGRSTAQGDAGLYEMRAGLATQTHRTQRYGEQQRASRVAIEHAARGERSSRRRRVRRSHRQTDPDRS